MSRRRGATWLTSAAVVALLALAAGPVVAAAVTSAATATAGTTAAVSAAPPAPRDLAAACPDDRVPSSRFRDTAGSDFAAAIDCLVWYAITQGTTARTFEPTAPVTRRQMALFLHRALDGVVDLPAYTGTSRFDDVPATGIGSAEINVLASPQLEELLGVAVVTGRGDGTYDPGGRVTRAQMGSFIARVLAGLADHHGAAVERGSCTFPDAAAIAPIHADNVALLCELGVVAGRGDGRYDPTSDITRGQMAAFLTRSLDVLVEADVVVPPDHDVEVFVDAGSCPSTGADGTAARPFCSVARGLRVAADQPGRGVTVTVASGTYEEDLVIDGHRADAVAIVGAPFGRDGLPAGAPTVIAGRHRVVGDGFVDLVDLVLGTPPGVGTPGPAVTVSSTGETYLSVLVTDQTAGVAADAGLTVLVGSVLVGNDVGYRVGPGARGDAVGSTIVDGGVAVEVAAGASALLDDNLFGRNDRDLSLPLDARRDVVDVVGNQFDGSKVFVVDTSGAGRRLGSIADANTFVGGVRQATLPGGTGPGSPALLPR